jgi:hypothetical protein
VNFYIFDLFSRTIGPILTRLGTNDPWGGDTNLDLSIHQRWDQVSRRRKYIYKHGLPYIPEVGSGV